MHRVVSHGGAVVSAREVVPGRAGAARQPDVERIEDDTIRIIGIDRDALVIPVLRIIAAAEPTLCTPVSDPPAEPAMKVQLLPPSLLAHAPSWQPSVVPQPLALFQLMDPTWA